MLARKFQSIKSPGALNGSEAKETVVIDPVIHLVELDSRAIYFLTSYLHRRMQLTLKQGGRTTDPDMWLQCG
jgi:hypothetical protein